MKIVFFGSSKFVLPILEVLRNNFELSLVVTTEKYPTDPVQSYCLLHKLHYYVVIDYRDKTLIRKIAETNSEMAVLAYFGLILPETVLNLFPKGILNIHPSLLPKYRGSTPVQTAILNGDKQSGVSLIKLDEEVDHGPILAQEKEPIFPNDTAESLYQRLFQKGAKILEAYLPKYLHDELTLQSQDDSEATFTKHLTRESGYFDINNPPQPEILDRMIRAYYPWPGLWTRLMLRTHLNKEQIIKFLPNKKIQVEGRKPMSYKDFINGYPNAKGVILPILPISNFK